MTQRKRLCLLLAVLTLLLALSACGEQSKLMLATTGMEPTLDLTLPDTITLPDKGRDTVYKSYVDKAYSMALAAAAAGYGRGHDADAAGGPSLV